MPSDKERHGALRTASFWLGLSLCGWGQTANVVVLPGPPGPAAAPEWLAPFPQVRGQAASRGPTSAYTAVAAPADVIAHYEREMRAAGVAFQTKGNGIGTTIEASTEQISAVIRVQEQDGGTKVNVSYAAKRVQTPAAAPTPAQAPTQAAASSTQAGVLPPLTLEWPAWLAPPGGRLVSQRTIAPGRAVSGEEFCPGDVMQHASQGCLKRTYQAAGNLKDTYAYFEGLLTQYGYTTQNASPQPYANLQLGKWVSDVFGSFILRQYPQPQQASYYREINAFLRQAPPATGTQVEITFLVKNGTAGVGNPLPPQSGSTAAPARSAAPADPSRKGDGFSFPPRGTWKWTFQSVAQHRGSEVKYVNYYYEAATDRSVDQALPLPLGGIIVGVFPDDCAFGALDDKGHALKFGGQNDAKGKELSPGGLALLPIQFT